MKSDRPKSDERGQTALEYALLAMCCVPVLILATVAVLDAVSDFYTDLTRLICLPLP